MSDLRVRFFELDEHARVRVSAVAPDHDFDPDAADTAWESLKLKNPRYFDAPILSYESHVGSTINASVRPYRYHAVRDISSTGVDLLSVTCLLSTTDTNGVERFMLGLRSATTHRYGGLWEFGPAGAMDAPDPVPGDGAVLSNADLIDQARREAFEEAGFEFDPECATVSALLFDDAVGSVDIIVRVSLNEAPAPTTNWEYGAVRWAAITELNEWARARPHTLIPPAIQIIRWLSEIAYPSS